MPPSTYFDAHVVFSVERENRNLEGLQIEGYSLEVGEGLRKEENANARICVYVSEYIQYQRRRDLEAAGAAG